jgi:hypothetical protein
MEPRNYRLFSEICEEDESAQEISQSAKSRVRQSAREADQNEAYKAGKQGFGLSGYRLCFSLIRAVNLLQRHTSRLARTSDKLRFPFSDAPCSCSS